MLDVIEQFDGKHVCGNCPERCLNGNCLKRDIYCDADREMCSEGEYWLECMELEKKLTEKPLREGKSSKEAYLSVITKLEQYRRDIDGTIMIKVAKRLNEIERSLKSDVPGLEPGTMVSVIKDGKVTECMYNGLYNVTPSHFRMEFQEFQNPSKLMLVPCITLIDTDKDFKFVVDGVEYGYFDVMSKYQ